MTLANLMDPKILADPYPFYSELRKEAPAVQVDPEGMWAVTRFTDVI